MMMDVGWRYSNLVMATQPRVPSATGQLLSAYTITHSPTPFSYRLQHGGILVSKLACQLFLTRYMLDVRGRTVWQILASKGEYQLCWK